MNQHIPSQPAKSADTTEPTPDGAVTPDEHRECHHGPEDAPGDSPSPEPGVGAVTTPLQNAPYYLGLLTRLAGVGSVGLDRCFRDSATTIEAAGATAGWTQMDQKIKTVAGGVSGLELARTAATGLAEALGVLLAFRRNAVKEDNPRDHALKESIREAEKARSMSLERLERIHALNSTVDGLRDQNRLLNQEIEDTGTALNKAVTAKKFAEASAQAHVMSRNNEDLGRALTEETATAVKLQMEVATLQQEKLDFYREVDAKLTDRNATIEALRSKLSDAGQERQRQTRALNRAHAATGRFYIQCQTQGWPCP